mmetsp:Transcript_25422/g.47334  ORF Transcript_25422/g.47334 Transcript_25422/m.47334 type:complete len:296 (-) Transcript_25422:514-1401(-)
MLPGWHRIDQIARASFQWIHRLDRDILIVLKEKARSLRLAVLVETQPAIQSGELFRRKNRSHCVGIERVGPFDRLDENSDGGSSTGAVVCRRSCRGRHETLRKFSGTPTNDIIGHRKRCIPGRDAHHVHGVSPNIFDKLIHADAHGKDLSSRSPPRSTERGYPLGTTLVVNAGNDDIRIVRGRREIAGDGIKVFSRRARWYLRLRLEDEIVLFGQGGQSCTNSSGEARLLPKARNSFGPSPGKSLNRLGKIKCCRGKRPEYRGIAFKYRCRSSATCNYDGISAVGICGHSTSEAT